MNTPEPNQSTSQSYTAHQQPDLNPQTIAFLEAAAATVLCFDRGIDMRGPLAKLSNAYHEALGEWPCDTCDRWTTRDSRLCEEHDPAVENELKREERKTYAGAERAKTHLCSVCAVVLVIDAGEACPDCIDPEAA